MSDDAINCICAAAMIVTAMVCWTVCCMKTPKHCPKCFARLR